MSEVNRLVYSVEVTEDKIHIIHLKDVFDPSTVEEFEHVLEYLLNNEHYKVVVNMARVEFVSSAGWGTCTSVLNQCRNHGGDIVLVGMQPEVFDVFMLLELDTFIEAFPGVDVGLKHFRAKSFVVKRANEIIETEKVRGKKVKNGAVTREKFQLPPDDEFDDDEIDESAAETLPDDEPAADNSHNEASGHESIAEPETEAEQPPETPSGFVGDASSGHTGQPVQQGGRPAGEMDSGFVNTPPADTPKASAPDQAKSKDESKKFFDTEHYFGRPLAPSGDRQQGKINNSDSPRPKKPQHRTTQFGKPVLNTRGDQLLERIVKIIVANPTYGPSTIRLALIRNGYADSSLTRSMIFKKLNAVNLSTRNKRIEFSQAQRR